MTGEVIKGEFAEQTLGNLSEKELQTLLDFFANEDKKSYYMLQGYMRSRGFTQQQGPHNHTGQVAQNNTQSIEEALEILGFRAMPTKKEIIATHRRLMSKLHPDKGGSDYLAARVNKAREVLLEALEDTPKA